MAKVKKAVETVTLTSPTGTKVTVSKESAEKFKARGYKAARTSTSSTSQ